MGNNLSLGDNQDVEYQSGASRLCNSIFVAICLAPLLVLGSMFLLGWNEKRAVCDAKAIAEGKSKVKEVTCTMPSTTDSGDLIMFSCDLEKEGLPFFSLSGTDFASLSVQGTGLSTKAEMMQCVEHSSSKTEKTSGGGTRTITTYTYSVEWVDHYIDSSSFHKRTSTDFMTNCGVDNPQWPAGLPKTGTQQAKSAKVGPFTIPDTYVNMVPLSASVPVEPPAGWTTSGSGCSTNKYEVPGQSHSIGQARVSFTSNDWSEPTMTVLGKNNGGTIGAWTASKSWLCSGSTLTDLRVGIVSKDDLFARKASESTALTWILRLVGFFLMWFACSRFAGPLGVVADCIPCVGPWIGDQVEAIACCISCFPACACTLGIVGIVWVAMRPLYGVPMILIFLCTCCAGIAFKARSQQSGGFGQQARQPFV